MYVLIWMGQTYGLDGPGELYIEEVLGPFQTIEEARLKQKSLKRKGVYVTEHIVRDPSVY